MGLFNKTTLAYLGLIVVIKQHFIETLGTLEYKASKLTTRLPPRLIRFLILHIGLKKHVRSPDTDSVVLS